MNWSVLIPDAPFDWELIPLDGHKRPIDPDTGDLMTAWQSRRGYDVEGLSELNGLVKAAGLKLGPDSGGVLAVDFDGPNSLAKFEEVFGRKPTDLPRTVGVTSGKPSRGQRLFLVDQDWWPSLLGGRKWKQDGSTCLELRWAGHQSVIAGEHPETGAYRWMDNSSPADLPMATAPDWLLEPLQRDESQLVPFTPSSEDATRAVAMLQHIDPLARTSYDDWMEIGMALHHTDPGLLTAWVDWSRPMPNFDEGEHLHKWKSFGNGYRGTPSTIRTLHHYAKAGGYKEPKRQPPTPTTPPTPLERHEEGLPQEDIRDQFLRDAEGLKARLDRGLDQIDAIEDVASRSVALHTLRVDLNLSEKNFLALVQALSAAKAPKVSESFDDLMAEDDDEVHALVEDLFPAGLVLIAAEGFAGKSSAAYQIAEAATNGSKFAGQFQCQQSAALIIQMDESLTDAKKKWRRMGLNPAKGQLTIKWKFSPMMFPELRRWIEEKQSKLVVLDSLMTIAGGTISPKDAEFGLLIYRLNELAGELGITIICLHHVVKGNTKRSDITKEDIFGTAYVYNGASDAWGLWRTTEDGTGDVLFNLCCLKARSGLVEVGTTYQFTGNDEDRRMTFKGMADRSITLNEIHTAREKVVRYLMQGNGAAFTPQQLCQNLQLGSVKYAAKLCGELYDRRATTSIDRKALPPSGGRPGYGYFHSARNSYTKVEKVKVLSEELSSSPNSTPFPPIEEPSEREERECVECDLSTNDVLRARDEDLPDWITDTPP